MLPIALASLPCASCPPRAADHGAELHDPAQSADTLFCTANKSMNASCRRSESADAASNGLPPTRSEGGTGRPPTRHTRHSDDSAAQGTQATAGLSGRHAGDGGQIQQPMAPSDARLQADVAAPELQRVPVMGLVMGQQVHVLPAQQRQQDQAEITFLASQVRFPNCSSSREG